jgi:AraC-like DNA-binding protein
MLGPDLAFSGATAELVFDPDALGLPLRLPAALELRRYRSSAGRTSIHDTARGVLRVLRESLGDDRPSAAAVAERLAMNLRTMQRHLSAWGVTFEEILDQYRYRTALNHLRAGKQNVTEIAFHLGYSDSAHFTRAFRRWTGLAPSQALDALAGRPLDPAPLHWEAEPLAETA